MFYASSHRCLCISDWLWCNTGEEKKSVTVFCRNTIASWDQKISSFSSIDVGWQKLHTLTFHKSFGNFISEIKFYQMIFSTTKKKKNKENETTKKNIQESQHYSINWLSSVYDENGVKMNEQLKLSERPSECRQKTDATEFKRYFSIADTKKMQEKSASREDICTKWKNTGKLPRNFRTSRGAA